MNSRITPDSIAGIRTLRPRAAMPTDRVAAVMRGNTRRDTSCELRVRSELFRRGLRFRVDQRIYACGVWTRPDVSFPRLRIAIFVDGCYWHACPTHFVPSRTNTDYWSVKLESNVRRDRRQDAALRQDGWVVVRRWGHESASEIADEVQSWIESKRSSGVLAEAPIVEYQGPPPPAPASTRALRRARGPRVVDA
jgi:DNA mismatch endonuclease, patch repair protein